MRKNDKIVLIGAIITTTFLLYLIKPAPVNAYCSDWESQLYHKFTDLDSQKFTEEISNQWMTLQREDLIYTTACSDISIFFI